MIEETAEPQQQQKSEQNKPKQFVLDRNSLQEYYQQNFPINQFYDWLCYSESQEYFQKREFSFTFPGDVYWRYIFFNSKEHLLQTLIEKVPEKIDIGAVFNKQGQKGDMNLKAIEKEFVIDIDMTDYDNIRTCCTGANICEKCWKFMKYACELISKTLEDFDFKHVLWVYSGRRGIHAWICDSNVRKSSDKIRSCIIEHMNLIIDNDKSDHYLKSQLVNLKSHYLIDRAFLKDGLNKGKHGFNIYEYGNLYNPGGHYNPFNKQHGGPESKNRHVGDLGNIDYYNKNLEYAEYEIEDDQVMLTGQHNIIGRACVVHKNEDDLGLGGNKESQCDGNAGQIVAFGVVGLSDKFNFYF
ncbi:hypothetical protein IMG5_052000 [Ichthyophthirius multifiliis]|uniref:DNA primase n=1 Tax=Ichthyophthirius multifiliis TaxID=5932 RepID=G0QMU9_ICHMU|nr:hypothetical protein IMG5_052000 [Ichthyophthirius multifiliis]EGR33459.1 hypothetical protein IMG5_052000 [Ichthyophthirius multifiliis]|eukprot:XP_004037445.1 hypothetical protein IMG5_052000 [Ichthyophthirius multifiliis]